MLDFDAIVRGLEAMGVPKERAEVEARRQLGVAAPGVETPDEEAMRAKLEKEHEREADKLMLALGWELVRFSHPGRTKQTPGISDRRYYHRKRRVAVWVELKADGGRQRPDQRAFQEMVEACGETYVLGGLGVLKAWLVERGYATQEGPLLVPTPIKETAA